jgi:hypothetical protein
VVLVQLAGLPLAGNALGEHPAGSVVAQANESGEVGVVGEAEVQVVHVAILARARTGARRCAYRPNGDADRPRRSLQPQSGDRLPAVANQESDWPTIGRRHTSYDAKTGDGRRLKAKFSGCF